MNELAAKILFTSSAVVFGVFLIRPMRNCTFLKALSLMAGFVLSVALAWLA